MSRFTNAVKARIKQYILDATIQRLTVEETISYIDLKLHVKIHKRHVEYMRAEVKQQAKEEFERLRSDGLSYKLAFMDRIDEIRNLQRKQWQLFEEYKNSPYLRQRCLIELHSLTQTLTNLYDLLPAVDSLQNVRTEFKESNKQEEDQNRKF